MQQTHIAVNTSNNGYQTWMNQRCKQVIFNTLNTIESGHILFIDGTSKTGLGNTESLTHAQIIIHHDAAYRLFVRGGSIGAAEAYIQGLWSSPDLTKVILFFAQCQKELDAIEQKAGWLSHLKTKFLHYVNRNTQSGSKKNILAHYDLGNDLYTRFLDPEMMYSAAIYPSNTSTLDEAQVHKLDTICKKLELKPTDHLIEIGTGWGGMAIYAAQHYGCKVTTTTISDAQHQYAQDRINNLGLNDKITLLKKDYRELTGKYDKLVSIEMIEAVGYDFFQTFFEQCNALLKPQGKLLIQAITIADQRFEHYLNNVDFIQRYIFPGGFLPSITEMCKHITQHTDMVVENIDDIGLDYARTVNDWNQRFNAAWPELKQLGYDETFKKLWNYYLHYCEGAFLARSISTVHVVARK
ncbi:SAM-dependent methyltransferase [Algibacillus agarilyticus]|uniref:SAM-dependent methyltransferase n=1 Tax=Algibacillus agarilyticus TaxID=2234133 RepID=UPI000DD01A1A|nr:cyclopropane-fatty-acyl-phospholipid synthase family protein [Algibacillus agarilyticus]